MSATLLHFIYLGTTISALFPRYRNWRIARSAALSGTGGENAFSLDDRKGYLRLFYSIFGLCNLHPISTSMTVLQFIRLNQTSIIAVI